jgi:CNT family concentrative nucleoside transporter
MQAVLGIVVLIALAWALSTDPKGVDPRRIAIALGAQIALAFLMLNVPLVRNAFGSLNKVVAALETATQQATSFMFGFLAGGGPRPYPVQDPNADFVLAFRVLPLILVVSAISAVLFHWRILPWVIKQLGRLLQKGFRISGALAFAAASSIFLGIIESPLVIKPYLDRLSRSELFALMTCGMSTVAGTVMVLYAAVLGSTLPDALGHILVASVVSVPAALLFSHVMMPGNDDTADIDFTFERTTHSAMEALINGTVEGIKMCVNIAAIIIVLFAIINLINMGLTGLPTQTPITLQMLLGTLFRPFMWLIGIPWNETAVAGELMGTKTILNEFVAYLGLGQVPAEALSEKSRIILMYAMCGFANLGSLGILVGGLGAILPERREEIIALASRSIASGTLATLMTGAIVGLII